MHAEGLQSEGTGHITTYCEMSKTIRCNSRQKSYYMDRYIIKQI